MKLSRFVGTATVVIVSVVTVCLAACGTTNNESCGTGGLLNGNCEPAGTGRDSCPTGTVFINTTDSPSTSCPNTYNCCGPTSGTGTTTTTGSGSGT